MAADIAECRRPEQRIHYRVRQHIGIRMPEQSERVVYLHTAEYQLSVLGQSVNVVAVTYARNNIFFHMFFSDAVF